jgi:hypothetical protein
MSSSIHTVDENHLVAGCAYHRGSCAATSSEVSVRKLTLMLWAVLSGGMLCACRRGALVGVGTLPARTAPPQPGLGARGDCHQ